MDLQKELEKKAQNSIEGQYSYPIWWINHLIKQYPEQYKTILEAGNHKPPLTLRVNQQKISRDQYLLQLSELSIEDFHGSEKTDKLLVNNYN